jgi:hypothetical protein
VNNVNGQTKLHFQHSQFQYQQMELLGLGAATVVATLGRGVVRENKELAAAQSSSSGLGLDCINQIS